MTTFSELYGYKPDRSRLHQFEEMDDLLKDAIWNFMRKRYFAYELERYGSDVYTVILRGVWTEVIRRRLDDLWSPDHLAVDQILSWFSDASWNEVYDILQYLLKEYLSKSEINDANAMLRREGSAYRFIGGVIAPITNDYELAEIEDALQHTRPFDAASQHIKQAVNHLADRGNPDARNTIKEAISAVESAIKVASGNPNADIEKGLKKLGLHSQLEQAWKNMYNWTSDEGGVRHGKEEISQVGLPEARYMVVACSAFVNYLVSKDSESDTR